jgi:N-carbamoyl-L-amino-acid hydrolase
MQADLLRRIPNTERLAGDILTMATFTDPEQRYTRRPFTKLFQEGRCWLREEMEAAGLNVTLDAAGNLVGRREGREDLPPLMIGSHTDTVAGGGRFDGVIGVIGGLEVARCLDELGISLRHPLEVVDFLAEEPTDFGVSTVGSRGMVGALSPELLAKTNDRGRPLADALSELGGRPEEVPSEVRQRGDIAAYLEMHIEQGPVLDREGIPLAAVTGIAGIRRFTVTIDGEPNHAGTTPMELRRDALVAASRFIIESESIFRSEPNSVGTIGYLQISPNMANVVPGQAELIVEMRSIDPKIIDRIDYRLHQKAREIAEERAISIKMDPLTDASPVQADPRLIEITTNACRQTDPRALVLPSGAGHDATQIGTIAPIGMIFVPSRDGISHNPAEWTDSADIALGVQALARALILADQAF